MVDQNLLVEWYHDDGGGGRAGNFTIATRSYAYTQPFTLAEGGDGFNNAGGGLGSGGGGGSFQ